MKWYAQAFDHAAASLEFINRHNLTPDTFKVCAYHVTLGVNVILVYYLAEGPLE